jgi:hypothetical protein
MRASASSIVWQRAHLGGAHGLHGPADAPLLQDLGPRAQGDDGALELAVVDLPGAAHRARDQEEVGPADLRRQVHVAPHVVDHALAHESAVAGGVAVRGEDAAHARRPDTLAREDAPRLVGAIPEVGAVAVAGQLDEADLRPAQAPERVGEALDAEAPVAPGQLEPPLEARRRLRLEAKEVGSDPLALGLVILRLHGSSRSGAGAPGGPVAGSPADPLARRAYPSRAAAGAGMDGVACCMYTPARA